MLFVDRIQERTKVLGPGIRAAIWFHGCSRRCPGCVAYEMNLSTDFFSYDVEFLLKTVSSIDNIEGLTISGGEPFQQDLDDFYNLLARLRAETSLTIMCYTGYTMAELVADPQKKRLLAFIDILVDGPYVQELDRGQLWRGSENQTIYFLSSAYSHLAKGMEKKMGRPVEIQFANGLDFSFTGVPPKGFKDSIKRKLAENGMNVSW